MINPIKRESIMFFANNAGYCTPPGRMACAKSLSDAEAFGQELNLTVTWEYEQDCWLDYVGDYDSERTWNQRFESGSFEVLFAYIKADDGEIIASLGGIVFQVNDVDYRRVIEAELLEEAIETIKSNQ